MSHPPGTYVVYEAYVVPAASQEDAIEQVKDGLNPEWFAARTCSLDELASIVPTANKES